MPTSFRYWLFIISISAAFVAAAPAQTIPTQRILILFEGNDVPLNYGRGDARQLAVLLGHFNVDYKIESALAYKPGELQGYDHTFVIGFTKRYDPPDKLMKDVFAAPKPIVWMNTGFDRLCQRYNVEEKFGFTFSLFDTVSNFDVVRAGNRKYSKGEPNLNIVTVSKSAEDVEILATAYSTERKKEAPYILRNGNLMYIGDSPFASATETDRYLYFADLLHDILGQDHDENHRALLRIEDVNVFENPDRLRAIADMLYSRKVPFLVGVIPFFVDPQSTGGRVSMSDKPEFVDALHYMTSHGATLVMHGITHQYQGVTAVDYEFWDAASNKPIRNDSKEYVEKKMRMGLEEFWKNNLYPLVWETPHYTATQLDYSVFAEFFSTAMEQRMVIDDPDYSQYVPYIINRDLHGQRLIPETVGYIPLNDTAEVEEGAVAKLVAGARACLGVRDGFASAFIHPVIDLRYMEEFVDSVQGMGYTFMNVKDEPCTVKLKDRIIMTGAGTYNITLEDQYLREVWLQEGEVDRQTISANRINGPVQKSIVVPQGMIYLAEPSEYRATEQSWFEKVTGQVKTAVQNFMEEEESFGEIRVGVRWYNNATGSGRNDQASFVSAFRSLNIPVDTIRSDSVDYLGKYSLIVVPYNTVEHMSSAEYDRLVDYVEAGGNVITDGKSEFAAELGIKFAGSTLRIERMRDQEFPEDALSLRQPEIMTRFDADHDDEVLCSDERTDAPVVIGRKRADGKFIYLGIRFDPQSSGGFSRFPYLIEYVQRYLHLRPYFKRENLEVYFDPGYRRNVSEEDLVKRWVSYGIRRVHVAGWHEYEKYTYAYDKLIKLCHANGILVYVWLEPPMVSRKFWQDHPQWQERNYKGEALPPAWRYVMALTAPECLTAVRTEYANLISRYDWDGVNLAELYFESPNGPGDPGNLSPMHPSAREEFRHKNGFDPAQIVDSSSSYFWKRNSWAWNRFVDYRVETIVRLHDDLLTMVDQLKQQKPHLDVVVTTMDQAGTPELRANIAVDVKRLAALRSRHNFLLQIQDPATRWNDDPRRYAGIARGYADIVPDSAGLMLDLNIYSFRPEDKPTQFPTSLQTGIECYQLIHSAATGANRFTIYSESSMRPQDLRMAGFAASAPARIDQTENGWSISSPFPLVAELPSTVTALDVSLGHRIYSEDGRFYLPAGTYSASVVQQTGTPFSQLPIGGRLFSITADLKSLSVSSRSVTMQYASRTRCIASFNHPPYNILVDGSDYPFEALEGYKRFSVILPPGEHTVIAVLETNVSYGVDLTSFWSSWIIVIVGFAAGAALLILYIIVRISRPSTSRV